MQIPNQTKTDHTKIDQTTINQTKMDQITIDQTKINQTKIDLYLKQKELLETFLEHGTISKAQYDKSLGDLTIKMLGKKLED